MIKIHKKILATLVVAVVGLGLFGFVPAAFAAPVTNGCFEHIIGGVGYNQSRVCYGQNDANGNPTTPDKNCYLLMIASHPGQGPTPYSQVDCSTIDQSEIIGQNDAGAGGGTSSSGGSVTQTDNFGVVNIVQDSKCDAQRKSSFLGIIPTWYEYLPYGRNSTTQRCEVGLGFVKKDHTLDLSSVLLIGLAVLDGLLRLAGVVAVGFIIAGGFRYVLSQGEPDNTKQALQTIINACIGLAIALVAAVIVSFIGNKLGG